MRITFSPATVSGGGTSTAFIWAGFTTPPGSCPIKITGTSDGRSGSVDYALTVTR